jgi:hypothetical protein
VRFKHRDKFCDRSRRVPDGVYAEIQIVVALVARYGFQTLG